MPKSQKVLHGSKVPAMLVWLIKTSTSHNLTSPNSLDTHRILVVSSTALEWAFTVTQNTRVSVLVSNVFGSSRFAISTGAGALRDTDICDHALDVLSSAGAGLRRVVILGRRGHVQASFTIKASPGFWDSTMRSVGLTAWAFLCSCEKNLVLVKTVLVLIL